MSRYLQASSGMRKGEIVTKIWRNIVYDLMLESALRGVISVGIERLFNLLRARKRARTAHLLKPGSIGYGLNWAS